MAVQLYHAETGCRTVEQQNPPYSNTIPAERLATVGRDPGIHGVTRLLLPSVERA